MDNLDRVSAGRALLMLERGGEIGGALKSAGTRVEHWDRRAGGQASVVSAWPPDGHFDWIGLRLPRAVEELRMFANVAGARLAPGGVLWVYGAGDEGVMSVKKRLDSLFGSLEDLAVGGRCRVIQARDPVDSLASDLSDWVQPISDPRLPRDPWVSFPGCFAHGRVDEGTALLLSHLPVVTAGARVLDFACGSGVVAGVLCAGVSDVEIVVLDNDALSLDAAGQNLPGATLILSQGFSELGFERFDWIVSNPPYHLGKAGTAAVLEELCIRAGEYLRPGGGLRCVVQSTHALAPILEKNFSTVSVIAETPGFRVWDSLMHA